MVLETVYAWVLSFIVAAAAPDRKVGYPEGVETKEEALARYEDISHDLVDVVYDPETPALFSGPNGRSRTLVVALSVIQHESSFFKHVDYGLGKRSRGDHGQSWCLMQLKIGQGKTAGGYTGPELVEDRKKCFSEGIKVLKGSFASCRRLPLQDRLRAYASGSCEKGGEASRNRMVPAINWYWAHPATFTDQEVMAALEGISEPIEIPPPSTQPSLISFAPQTESKAADSRN